MVTAACVLRPEGGVAEGGVFTGAFEVFKWAPGGRSAPVHAPLRADASNAVATRRQREPIST